VKQHKHSHGGYGRFL